MVRGLYSASCILPTKLIPNNFYSQADPAAVVSGFLAALTSLNLLLAIPPLVITIPSLPTSRLLPWPRNITASKLCFLTLIFVVCFVPQGIYGVLCDVLVVIGLLGTYVLPGRRFTYQRCHRSH